MPHPDSNLAPPQARQALRTFYQTSDPYLRGLRERETDAHCGEYLRVVRAYIPPPARILDAGCGTGYAATRLVEAGFEVVGMDISLKFLDGAPGRPAGRPRYVVGDAIELPFRDGEFDAVASFDVVEHIPDAERALREMGRVIRPGGRVVVICPNYWSPVIPLKALRNLLGGGRGYLSFYETLPSALTGLMTTTWRTTMKLCAPDARFTYRKPRLEGMMDADCDCVYLPSPVDFLRFFRRAGFRVVRYSGEGSSRLRRWCSSLLPSFAPTVYFVAEKPLSHAPSR